MPFPIIYVLDNVSWGEMEEMRRVAVTRLSEMMEVSNNWVVPYLIVNGLHDPENIDEGGRTIFIQLNTTLFTNRSDADEFAPKVTLELAQAVSDVIDGRYEVECIIPGGKKEWIGLVEAKNDSAPE